MNTAVWETLGHQNLRIVFADRGSDVAYVPPCDGDNGNADAQRIVECVNACDGIEDPETTVPELVGLAQYAGNVSGGLLTLADTIEREPTEMRGAIKGIARALERKVDAVLSRRGRSRDPPEP